MCNLIQKSLYAGFLMLLFSTFSCNKEDSSIKNTYNDALVGEWNITEYTYETYTGGQVTTTQTFADAGSFNFSKTIATSTAAGANIGTLNKGKALPNFPVFNLYDNNNNCANKYRWTCDKHRITFGMGNCYPYLGVYVYTLEGWGTNNLTFFRITTDNSSNIINKEMLKIKKI